MEQIMEKPEDVKIKKETNYELTSLETRLEEKLKKIETILIKAKELQEKLQRLTKDSPEYKKLEKEIEELVIHVNEQIAGKRKSRRNRKSKKGKKSRKARKSNRRRGRR